MSESRDRTEEMTPEIGKIDLEKTLRGVFDRKETVKAYMGDPTHAVDGAIGYARDCMAEAMGDLTLVVAERGGQAKIGGWDIRQQANEAGNSFDMILSRPDRPGAWHLGVRFAPSLNDPGLARQHEMHAEEEAQVRMIASETGQDEKRVRGARIIESVLRGTPDGPVGAEYYRSAQPGDRVERITGTGLLVRVDGDIKALPGRPPGLDADDTTATAEQILSNPPAGAWWPGVALDLRPTMRYPSNPELESWKTGHSSRTDGFMGPELLCVVSGLLLSENLHHKVSDRDHESRDRALWSPANERWRHFEEAGIALVRDSHGMLDARALHGLGVISAAASGQLLAKEFAEGIKTIGRLGDLGFNDPKTAYECNDMRDICHVTDDGGTVMFHLETQNGSYRMDHDADTGSLRVHGKNGLVGDFRLEDLEDPSSLREIWSARNEDDPDFIAYTARNVRDLNNVILSLSSIGCNLDMDHPIDDGPSPY